jgi:hypothetical protein
VLPALALPPTFCTVPGKHPRLVTQDQKPTCSATLGCLLLPQTFGEILIPSLVNLTLVNSAQTQTNGNLSTGVSFIDCVQWTNDLITATNQHSAPPSPHFVVNRLVGPGTGADQGCNQVAFDWVAWCMGVPHADWKPPVDYQLVPLTQLFAYPAIWPAVRQICLYFSQAEGSCICCAASLRWPLPCRLSLQMHCPAAD